MDLWSENKKITGRVWLQDSRMDRRLRLHDVRQIGCVLGICGCTGRM
jgi:hypothetical protein